MIRYIIIINIIIIMIIIHYYCHHCHPFFFLFRSNGAGSGDQSLGGSLGSYRGDTVLLEVGGHGRVAAQSLTGALQPSVALYDPGAAAGLFSQHAAAAGGRRGCVRYRGAHRQTFGLFAGGREVWVVALKHAGDVVQEVIEKLWDALITRECIDVNDGMLACLIVDDDVDAKQGHSQRLPQRPGQLSDDIITGWLRHSLYILSRGQV